MNRIYVLLLRLVVGIFFAVFLMRMFHPDASVGYTVLLAVGMIGLAYVFESMRKGKSENNQKE